MTARAYRAPERCVELHAVLIACYELCCWAQFGRDGRVPEQRLEWNRKALDALANSRESLGGLMRCETPHPAQAVSSPEQALVAEAQVYAQSCRRYLLPEHAEMLHRTLLELWRVSCLHREALDLGPGERRKALYRNVLNALSALQPQLVHLVITPGVAADGGAA